MTITDQRMPLAPTEKQFMQSVVELARLCRWRVYHPWDSRRSATGFPDLTLLRGERLAFIELKTARGRVSPEQAEWLHALDACAGFETYLFRPADWPTIVRVLR